MQIATRKKQKNLKKSPKNEFHRNKRGCLRSLLFPLITKTIFAVFFSLPAILSLQPHPLKFSIQNSLSFSLYLSLSLSHCEISSLKGFNSKLQRLLGFRLLCALVGLLKTFWFQRANAWLICLGAVSASNCLLRWWDEEFG